MVLRSFLLPLALGPLIPLLIAYLSLSLFHFYYNYSSEYITRGGIKYFNLNNWARYVSEYKDRSYIVTRRQRVVVVSLISHSYSN